MNRVGAGGTIPSVPMRYLHLHGPGRAATSCAALAVRTGMTVSGLSGGSNADEARALLGDVPWTEAPPAVVSAHTLVLVGAPDDALDAAARDLAGCRFDEGCGVIHLSGVRGLEALCPLEEASVTVGAFHPLMSFPTHEPPGQDLGGALVAIEALAPFDAWLTELARKMGGSPFSLGAGSRAAYHLGAAAAGNGILAVLELSCAALRSAGVPQDQALRGLGLLMSGALSNASEKGIPEALTGPVARGDVQTLGRHLAAMEESLPGHRELYLALVRGLAAVCEQPSHDRTSGAVQNWLGEVDP